MRLADSSPTIKLATARLEFSSDRRIKQALRLAAVAAVLLLIATLAKPLLVDGAGLATLRERNSTLQAELARARMELELERSTRAALERQVAVLNRETSELKSRLDFFNAQSGHSDTSR